MTDSPYTKLPGFSRPLGYYLRQLGHPHEMKAYVFISRKNLRDIYPGQMEELNGEKMYRDNVGPLAPDSVPLKETFR